MLSFAQAGEAIKVVANAIAKKKFFIFPHRVLPVDKQSLFRPRVPVSSHDREFPFFRKFLSFGETLMSGDM